MTERARQPGHGAGVLLAMDWGNASYLGVDVGRMSSPPNRSKHETDKIEFQVGDITDELPAAELLISKDVLTLRSRSGRRGLCVQVVGVCR
jgi:hypothetical protein